MTWDRQFHIVGYGDRRCYTKFPLLGMAVTERKTI